MVPYNHWFCSITHVSNLLIVSLGRAHIPAWRASSRKWANRVRDARPVLYFRAYVITLCVEL